MSASEARNDGASSGAPRVSLARTPGYETGLPNLWRLLIEINAERDEKSAP